MRKGARRRPNYLRFKLRAIRAGLGGLTQAELIERLGLADYLNQGEISAFEKGVREPDLLTLKAYADAAGISTDDLIDDEVKLPPKLPTGRATGSSGSPRQQRVKAATNTTAVTLFLLIQSDEGSRLSENRARKNVEKAYLERYRMKKLKDHEYELTFSYEDDAELDDQIYTLLGSIYIEAKRSKCSIKVNAREKGSDRYW
jgi:transcriptional regulator with XRE-family HTH domain